jgi:hypothetical protein
MNKAAITVVFVSIFSPPLLEGFDGGESPTKQAKISEFMQYKQKLAHEVFDAIILNDFKRISKNANLLVTLSKAAEFQVHKTPSYLQHSSEFQSAAARMAQNARDQNQDGTTLAFMKLTLSCVHCHEYIRQHHRQ